MRAELYSSQERLADAMQHYRKAIEQRPDYIQAHIELGVRLLAGGNYAEALTHLEQANALSPPRAEIYLNLGDAYRANKQWQKAIDFLGRALQLDSELEEAHYNLGLLYMSVGTELPNMNELQVLEKAVKEFGSYRSMKGGQLRRDDPSTAYLEDLNRQIERAKRRIEREARNKAQPAAEPAKEGSDAQ
ncbi:MAG: tetratricopeptide repeat protein [Myxococcales bacterium]|nr:MAG: tetratricopeptide repeat protein [Myxococcales bacterium]